MDAFGNPENFGKQVGGDIIANKKTFLYLKAMENGNRDKRMNLTHFLVLAPKDPSDKIKTVKAIIRKHQELQKRPKKKLKIILKGRMKYLETS